MGGKKGINIVGTGDFTHPAWRAELAEKLEPAEPGLYMLKKEYSLQRPAILGQSSPRFVISGEISSIYKKNGRVRKVHSLILLPGLEAAEILSRRLEASEHTFGRTPHPWIGLSRPFGHNTGGMPGCHLCSGHIWTPHFSLFGAFSGFDTIEECYEELTPQIHALETGLSSDPAMNGSCRPLTPFSSSPTLTPTLPPSWAGRPACLTFPCPMRGSTAPYRGARALKAPLNSFLRRANIILTATGNAISASVPPRPGNTTAYVLSAAEN